MSRLLIPTLLLALLAQAFFGLPAFAHGPLLRGTALQAPGGYHGLTGECSCERQWYTMGFNPGTVKIKVILGRPGTILAPTYGLRATLVLGTRERTATVACATSDRHCQPAAHFMFSVKHRAVYYLMIDGVGAHGVPFAIQLHAGHMYPLHCRKFC